MEKPKKYTEEYYKERNKKIYNQLEYVKSNFVNLGLGEVITKLKTSFSKDPIAIASILFLETEECNIVAKNTEKSLKNTYYFEKEEKINELIKLFKINKWYYGYTRSNIPSKKHIIFFDLPGCGQISYHTTLEKTDSIPKYRNKWDGLEYSTFFKMEKFITEYFKIGSMSELTSLFSTD